MKPRLAGWYLLAVMAALVFAELGFCLGGSRTDEEWERLLASGTPREQVEAAYVLVNRMPEGDRARKILELLLASKDPLLREFAMTPAFTRDGDHIQRAYLSRVDDEAERVRSYFFLDFQVSLDKKKMTLENLREYFENLPEAGVVGGGEGDHRDD